MLVINSCITSAKLNKSRFIGFVKFALKIMLLFDGSEARYINNSFWPSGKAFG